MTYFAEYLTQCDSQKKERALLWRTSIGLQSVDRLSVSDFLIQKVRRHIEGEITMKEVDQLIGEHYKSKKAKADNK